MSIITGTAIKGAAIKGTARATSVVISLVVAVVVLATQAGCPQSVDPLPGGTATTTDVGGAGTTGTSTTLSCTLQDLDPATLPAVDGACREPELVEVVFNADGDTFVVDSSQGSETIRFIGVNTPETGYGDTTEECYGAEASAFTAANFPVGSCVWLTFDQGCLDPYDRTLAYLFTGAGDQDFYQRRLLREGYASVMIYSPNDAFEDTFRKDQAQAEADDVGKWSACSGR